jgi:signal transduction histidine kinase
VGWFSYDRKYGSLGLRFRFLGVTRTLGAVTPLFSVDVVARLSNRIRRSLSDVAVTPVKATPTTGSWIFAGILLILGTIEYRIGDFTWPVARLGVACVAFALVPIRRRLPSTSAMLALVANFAFELVAVRHDQSTVSSSAHVLAGCMLLFALCRWSSPPRVVIGLGSALVMLAIPVVQLGASFRDVVSALAAWIALACFALAMRYRANLVAQQLVDVRLAERNALARELHDSVAHHLSAIAVQAQAAQFVASTRPDQAQLALSVIEKTANDTIAEMRRMVGILRSDDEDLFRVAPSGLTSLASTGGAPTVAVSGETDLAHLPQSIASAVFRIAQEAVTNARSHSRDVTLVDVHLTTDAHAAQLVVRNDGLPTKRNIGGGFGLVGMRERVHALGGVLSAGPVPNVGWVVQASIPLERPA